MPNFSQRIPELDGIRGAAILLILGYHLFGLKGPAFLPGKLNALLSFGWSGVDLFFVLSGFLIGGILLDASNSSNYFRVFYIRRFYRILPLYALVCVASIALFFVPMTTHAWLFEGKVPWYAYLTFGQNFWMAKLNDISPRQIDSTWSLAIEEQFYLTLPLLIRMVSRKKLPYILGAGVVLAPVLRIALWFTLAPGSRKFVTYVLAPCRMDGLLLGVLAACAVRSDTSWDWLVKHKAAIGTASILLGAGILEMMHKKWGIGSFGIISFGYTWVSLFYLSLLLLALTQEGLVNRFFRLRPLMELGLLAYGLYLLNIPVLGVVYGLAGRPTPWIADVSSLQLSLLAGLLTFALAHFSWKYFERPLVQRGHHYRYRYADRLEPAVLVPDTAEIVERFWVGSGKEA